MSAPSSSTAGSTGSISGRVVGLAGGAVAGATVMLEAGPEPYPDIARVTAADGRFRFTRLAPGDYRVGVNGGGLGQRSEPIVVEAGLDATLEICLGG